MPCQQNKIVKYNHKKQLEMCNPRKTPRASWIDYDQGIFFVTICTKDKIHYFGKILNERMHLSKEGEILKNELDNCNIHHKNIEILLFVIMPNHLHAIVICRDIKSDVSANEQRNPNPSLRSNPDMARHVPTLSRYIASLKSAVSKQIHFFNKEFAWQPRYHDHLIRGNKDGNKIAEYIENNVEKWDSDCFNQ